MTKDSKKRAIFLDRDGVIVEDNGLLLTTEDIRIPTGVPEALSLLKEAGFALVVVSNQAIVARGLLSEINLLELQNNLEAMLQTQGAPNLDGFYFCPHHPSATLAAYRSDCPCRKPKPGLLLKAAQDLNLDLEGSFMIGDRPTDLLAGHRAGCQSIWVQTGRHADPPIETNERHSPIFQPEYVCDSLTAATAWILEAQ